MWSLGRFDSDPHHQVFAIPIRPHGVEKTWSDNPHASSVDLDRKNADTPESTGTFWNQCRVQLGATRGMQMLVFCSHRGMSLGCRECSHAVAHLVGKISFSGKFTCDGGMFCHAPVAEETNGIFGSPMVWGGTKMVGEVKCVPVVPTPVLTPVGRMDFEADKRFMDRDVIFYRLRNFKGWKIRDWDRWIKTNKLSLSKLRDLADVIGCRMDEIVPLPPGSVGVQVSCGEKGCRSEILYPKRFSEGQKS